MSDEDRYRRFNLRIPKDVFAALQVTADARSHSMNAEIIQRLEQSLQIGIPDREIKTDELTPEESVLINLLRNSDDDMRNAIFGILTAALRTATRQ